MIWIKSHICLAGNSQDCKAPINVVSSSSVNSRERGLRGNKRSEVKQLFRRVYKMRERERERTEKWREGHNKKDKEIETEEKEIDIDLARGRKKRERKYRERLREMLITRIRVAEWSSWNCAHVVCLFSFGTRSLLCFLPLVSSLNFLSLLLFATVVCQPTLPKLVGGSQGQKYPGNIKLHGATTICCNTMPMALRK